MDFATQFKITYLLIADVGGKLKDVFEPKMVECSIAFDSGDQETARAMLQFISSKVVEILE